MLLKSLQETGLRTSAGRLKEFVRRVLCLVGEAQAVHLGINRDLLLLVRRRLGMPLEPRGGRSAGGKPRQRFDPRNRRRRRIRVHPEPVRPTPTSSQDRSRTPPAKDQVPLASVASQLEPSPEEITAYYQLTRHELAVVNREARRKLRAFTRDVAPNWTGGTCINIKTREEYTPEKLRELFGLSYAEAESCFLTLDN